MIQDQLVDYIASQIKLGVSRDSVKTALVGVGWSAQDVEDTLKKVENPAAASAAAAASPMQPQKPAASSPAMSSPVVVKNPASQSIRVSDLVSASLTPTGVGATGQKFSPASMMQGGGQNNKISSASASVSAMGEMPKKRMGKSAFVMIGLILILAGVSAYLYFQNTSLSSQLQTAGGQGQGSAAQVTALNGQVQALTASSTALTAQIATLTAQVTALQADLSFLMVPTGLSATTPVSVTVSGVLSGGGKLAYVLTTAEGVKVIVKNSASADVQAALQPLVGAIGTPVEISGAHNPGSASVMVSEVNGQPIAKPAAVATTTTGMMATGTPTSTTQ